MGSSEMKRTIEEETFYRISIAKNKKLEELTKVKDRVAWLLANIPPTRNSDEVLIEKYRECFGKDCATESIRRSRQRLQNQEFWCPPLQEVAEQRAGAEQAVRQWARGE